MNRHKRRKKSVEENNIVNHTQRIRKESFNLGYYHGLSGEPHQSEGLQLYDYTDGYSHGERDRLIALDKATVISQTLALVAKERKNT